ncbi:MLP-like protein 423 [Sesamum indicum]|uniref:MLP-like protein 423 n=1 Tax=Sesamum indicum TaxID=4182 RepID=A0A6I9TPI7_SESIN|nr:MLP-like protein 423 [Sesamum indicum]
MASKLEVEFEMKSSPEKVWESIRESTTLFPKALPKEYESIEILEGDGKSVASVRLIKYPPGLSAISSTKEKIEVVDEGKKMLSYSVIGGDILKYYKNFKAHLSVSPKDEGSWVKWSCEFEKASEEVPNPDLVRDFAIKNFQDLDAYILGLGAV